MKITFRMRLIKAGWELPVQRGSREPSGQESAEVSEVLICHRNVSSGYVSIHKTIPMPIGSCLLNNVSTESLSNNL